MRLQVTVGNEVGLEVHEGVEVGFVITIVEGVGKLNLRQRENQTVQKLETSVLGK